jgi:quinol monooxygenase YgiN
MVRLFIRHDVADYDTWRVGYDAFDETRRGMGVTGDAVYQAVGNPNDVTVTHDFESEDAAKAVLSSPELKGAMENAGVVGEPQMWITSLG